MELYIYIHIIILLAIDSVPPLPLPTLSSACSYFIVSNATKLQYTDEKYYYILGNAQH